jgi:hypothetical protein
MALNCALINFMLCVQYFTTFFKRSRASHEWWCILVIPALRRLSQKAHGFKDNLDNLARSCHTHTKKKKSQETEIGRKLESLNGWKGSLSASSSRSSIVFRCVLAGCDKSHQHSALGLLGGELS